MAPFEIGDPAFHLVKNGAVTLYWRTEILEELVAGLVQGGYQIVRLDAGSWTKQADFHRDIKAALDFPDYYGRNLDAFNDCMRDVASWDYGASRDATGTVLVFTGYDAFASREPQAAQHILDIVALNARRAMLYGHRLLCLVQSNDPNIIFEPVGATPVLWNPAEWANHMRG